MENKIGYKEKRKVSGPPVHEADLIIFASLCRKCSKSCKMESYIMVHHCIDYEPRDIS